MSVRLNPAAWSGTERERWSFRMAWLAIGLLGMLLAWMLVRSAWLLVPADDGLASAPIQTAAADAPAANLSLAKWHLFGNAPQRRAVATVGAPETTLELLLRGTLADADPHQGMAVLVDKLGNERAWRVGEEVAPGVKLDEVHRDHVILLHEGVQETLTLPRSTPPPVAPAPGVRPGAAPRNTAPEKPGSMPVYVAPQIGGAALDWQKTMDAIAANPAQVASKVRVAPVIANGQIAGIRLAAADGDANLLGKYGLRPSDIVTAVNGVPVDSIERGRQIVESLGQASSVRVTVTRDGRPTEITVNLR